MFRIFRPKKLQEDAREKGAIDGWNSALDAVEQLIGEHAWAVEEDEPNEIFCDGCGQSLARALEGMRR